MKLLLDTHIFLWYISGDRKLPPHYKSNIQDSTNEVYLSVVSLWEIIIKNQIGKLPLPQPPEIYIPEQRKLHLISTLPLNESSTGILSKLPSIHRDPFDRILVCQAIDNGMTIVTVDNNIQAYPVLTLT
jgi:PIN domain nuclease of toxin-antitoxin system